MSSKAVFIKDAKNLRLSRPYEFKNKRKKMLSNNPIKQVNHKVMQVDSKHKYKHYISKLNLRCIYTGRKRGLVRHTKMTRMFFKESANKGFLIGIRKSSW